MRGARADYAGWRKEGPARASNAVAILIGARGAPPPNVRGSDGIVLSPLFAKDDVHGRATATRVTEEEREETDGAGGEDEGRTGEDGWR